MNHSFVGRIVTAAILCMGMIGTSGIRAAGNAPTTGRSEAVPEAWTISDAGCPAGCSAGLRTFLDEQKGRRVRIDAEGIDAPFLDGCATVSIDLERTDVTGIVDELNRIAPIPRFTRAMLPVEGAEVSSGWINCRDHGARTAMSRILSYAPESMLLLFEERSIITLVPSVESED